MNTDELSTKNETEGLNKHNVSGSNFCDLIAQHIKERNERLMKAMQVEIDCNHKWDEYGHGYKCSECGFYTGMNATLNRLIDESLTH